MTPSQEAVERINKIVELAFNTWEDFKYEPEKYEVNPQTALVEIFIEELQKAESRSSMFNTVELNHLKALVKHDNYKGDYYGNKDQYYRRGKRIYQKLCESLKKGLQ